ncbi:MAG: HD domain-containing phosphohydrolase [Acidobacteriota bacterium]
MTRDEAPTAEAPAAKPAAEEHPIAVLFVDDDVQVLASLKRLFHRDPRSFHFASSPAEARELLRRNRSVGVVVSDQTMPVTDGLSFLGSLQDERRELVKVLLTARDDTATLSRAINSGAVFRFLAKPWDEDELRGLIDDALRQAALLRENRRLRLLSERKKRQLARLNDQLEQQVAERTRHLNESHARLRQASLGIVRLLAQTVENANPELAGHGEEVARHAIAIGRRIGLRARQLDELRQVAVLHDVGLRPEDGDFDDSPDPAHPERAAELLAPLSLPREVVAGVRHHHERHDGTGFPAGLKGENIPLLARIVAVADAYVSMLHGRDGWRRQSPEQAQAELIGDGGRAFDPKLAAELVAHVMKTREPVGVGVGS